MSIATNISSFVKPHSGGFFWESPIPLSISLSLSLFSLSLSLSFNLSSNLSEGLSVCPKINISLSVSLSWCLSFFLCSMCFFVSSLSLNLFSPIIFSCLLKKMPFLSFTFHYILACLTINLYKYLSALYLSFICLCILMFASKLHCPFLTLSKPPTVKLYPNWGHWLK